ncbi:MAG: S49 family peptidase [Bacteroidota bacterium]
MAASKKQILHALIRGQWLIEPHTAASYWPRIQSFMMGKEQPSSFFFMDDDEKEEEPRVVAMTLVNGQWEAVKAKGQEGIFSGAPEGSIALIPIQGALMKADYCGDPGMATISKWVKEAETTENITGILLIQDSPGGTVDGTETLANAIGACEKPVGAFIDGMSASASYWCSSQANFIMLSGDTSEVGSIGTMFGIADMRGYWEEMGVKFHDVVADQSPDKNKDFYELLKGNYEPIKKNALNPITEVFHSSVQAGRPQVKKEALTGKMYLGNSAIEMGLADSIGTLEDALQQVKNIAAKGGSFKKSNNLNSNKMFDSKLDKAVKELAAKVKAGESISMDDVNPVNQELENAGLSGFVIATKAGLVEAKEASDKLEAVTAERDKFKKQAEELGKKPGAEHTKPEGKTQEGDSVETVTEDEDFKSYQHNLDALEEVKNFD